MSIPVVPTVLLCPVMLFRTLSRMIFWLPAVFLFLLSSPLPSLSSSPQVLSSYCVSCSLFYCPVNCFSGFRDSLCYRPVCCFSYLLCCYLCCALLLSPVLFPGFLWPPALFLFPAVTFVSSVIFRVLIPCAAVSCFAVSEVVSPHAVTCAVAPCVVVPLCVVVPFRVVVPCVVLLPLVLSSLVLFLSSLVLSPPCVVSLALLPHWRHSSAVIVLLLLFLPLSMLLSLSLLSWGSQLCMHLAGASV